MKIAHIDNNGNILGWYDDKIHKKIPSPNIEVTDKEWNHAISISANVINNGVFERVDKRTKADKDKDNEDAEWNEYLRAEAEAKRTAWKQAGKPKYGQTL